MEGNFGDGVDKEGGLAIASVEHDDPNVGTSNEELNGTGTIIV